jgi:hypothetical protein
MVRTPENGKGCHMLASSIEREPGVGVAVLEPDWESPAGGDEARSARLSVPPYIFDGPGDAHWIGQRCGALGTGAIDHGLAVVVFTCGCRAWVPRATLRPA